MIMRIDKAKAIKKAEIDYARKEGKLEVAANLLKKGMTPEEVAELTELSIERINELKENKTD
ncbi:hypothetical protein [Enterococcus pallens]|uniref:Transposase n=1 Tax=Enterococcus pallens ATCC BAA-351 TaxID=1158607 RepID=R2SD36_9ENTE|nr:hypothetical protein [Enterococcus pallens]EOH90789.1 hypothetical protein UAU_03328 [Enterococcus pallens ATCC BAA-351]EOH90791.1 hypothetical protein UAU_03330 [Enterococcus pallens ATCC BAA-351]EOU15987.1 hypothetical protein I588_03643 [Enterococcus pallens ATCC BAA-351]